MYKKLSILACVLIATLAGAALASTPQPPDVPRDYVVDLAGIMQDSRKAELNEYLRTLEQKTTAQVLVLTVQSLDGDSIEDFADTTFKKWKLGQKGKDNGVLIVVSLKDRKYRLEVGYGLESILPDSLVGSIGREYFVPYFRQGDYTTGIYAGTIAVIRTIATHEGVRITNGTEASRYPSSRPVKQLNTFQMIVLGIAGIIALILFITHPGQCFLLIMASQMGGRGGGWSGGSGGFGGGGSFGGGGGGSSGGGGASGGW